MRTQSDRLAHRSDPSLRPVIALDVDGVVNAGPTEATVPHRVHVPAERVPKSPFIRGYGATDMDVVVHLDPTVGAWITGLRRHADVYWATTWEHLANEVLAPLLGVDPLPLAMTVANNPPRFGYARDADSVGWKASVLRERFNGRPLVWIDDGAWDPPMCPPANLPAPEERGPGTGGSGVSAGSRSRPAPRRSPWCRRTSRRTRRPPRRPPSVPWRRRRSRRWGR